MHFIVEQTAFLAQIQRCQNVVDRKKINPILSNILLEVTSEGLRLTASDSVMYLTSTLEAEVKDEGSIIVPAKKTFEIIRELPPGYPVECTLDEHVLRIKCGRSRFKLNTMSGDAYPSAPEQRIEETFTVPPAALVKMIQSVVFCISSDETRKFLTGASFIFDQTEQRLRVRTSNGFHMALASLPLSMESNLSECIIPQRTLVEIRRLCDTENEPVTLCMGPHQMCLKTSDGLLYSKVVEDTFPSFEHLLPEQMPNMIELDKTGVEQVLRRCLLVSNEDTFDVKVSLLDQAIEVSAKNRNQESSLEQMDADVALEASLERPYSFAINGMFLREVLSVLPGSFVQIHFCNGESAMKIIDRDDLMTHYIMMPLRLDG
ncbi:MAG: DNA polymerase III subunit beta [Mariprofundaceae bacterium]|nr:DNA polymerase III subunit beta [Mariprofundaceae bacterium]